MKPEPEPPGDALTVHSYFSGPALDALFRLRTHTGLPDFEVCRQAVFQIDQQAINEPWRQQQLAQEEKRRTWDRWRQRLYGTLFGLAVGAIVAWQICATR
jgi:hypothetical protein